MAQAQVIMPGRVSEIRYAHNPATFAFDWGTRPVPADLLVTPLVGGGRQFDSSFIPSRQVQAGLLLLTLSVEQMNQLFVVPGNNPLALELKWGGLVQIVLEVKAALSANTGPIKPTVVALPDSVRYEIDSDVSAELAVQAAASAILSAESALSSKNAAKASEILAQQSGQIATTAAESAQADAQTATQAAETALDAVGNIMTYVGPTEYGVLLGLGGNIQYTQNNNRYKTLTITLL